MSTTACCPEECRHLTKSIGVPLGHKAIYRCCWCNETTEELVRYEDRIWRGGPHGMHGPYVALAPAGRPDHGVSQPQAD